MAKTHGDPIEEVREHLESAGARGREALTDAADEFGDRAAHAYGGARRRAARAYNQGYERGQVALRRSTDRVNTLSSEHPFLLAAAGLVGGLVIGMLLGSVRDRPERERRYR